MSWASSLFILHPSSFILRPHFTSDPAATATLGDNTTTFPVADGPHTPNGKFEMPVLWTRYHGKGRVFYNSLGHHADIVESEPCLTLMRRGFQWAQKGSDLV